MKRRALGFNSVLSSCDCADLSETLEERMNVKAILGSLYPKKQTPLDVTNIRKNVSRFQPGIDSLFPPSFSNAINHQHRLTISRTVGR